TKDSTAPTVSITIVESWINIANVAEVSLYGECSEEGRTVSVSVASSGGGDLPDEVQTTSSGCGLSISAYVYSQVDGTINITADIDDEAGNTAEQAFHQIEKDTQAPTVTINQPEDIISQYNHGSFHLNGTCSEDTREVSLSISSSGGGDPVS